MQKYENVEDYINSFNSINYNKEVYIKLRKLNEIIIKELTDSYSVISYGIPTFKSNQKPFKNIIHFGGYKNHISIYPGSEAIKYFASDLEDFKISKGTIQINLEQELPIELILKLLKYLKIKNL